MRVEEKSRDRGQTNAVLVERSRAAIVLTFLAELACFDNSHRPRKRDRDRQNTVLVFVLDLTIKAV